MNSNKKKVLITGGTGLIGSRLSAHLHKRGYEVALLSRAKETDAPYQTFTWDIPRKQVEEGAFTNLYAVIHLAGANVADKRWTSNRKELLIKSRTESIALLAEQLRKEQQKPSVFLGVSAIGYYGIDSGKTLLDEAAPPGDDFLAGVVRKWEAAYSPIESLGIRTALIRVGIVLSKDGGALAELASPIRWGFGAPLGSGDQWMSWIHIDDVCRIFVHLLENETCHGIYNGVAPEPVTNRTLTRLAAKALKRPLWLPNVPAFALRLALGELAQVVLGSNRVSCGKLLRSGFEFEHSHAPEAIEKALSG